jgi:hypothetical protein
VDERIIPENNMKQYKVRWKGKDKTHDSWRDQEDLNCEQLIKEYHERRQRKAISRLDHMSWEPTPIEVELLNNNLEEEEESIQPKDSNQCQSESGLKEQRSRTRKIMRPARLSLCCLPTYKGVTLRAAVIR